MPRKARFFIPEIPVHMVIRGNSRKTIFAETEDYQSYLQWLESGTLWEERFKANSIDSEHYLWFCY